MARLFVLCVIVGGVLLWLGVHRWKRARQQAILLVALAALFNIWWLVFLVTDGVHNIIHRATP